MALTDGDGVDVVVDVVPIAPQPVLHAVEVCRPGGTIIIAGVKGHDTTVALDTDKVLFKEITIHGVYSQGSQAYEEAIGLLVENAHNFARLHTHEFPLDEAERALQTLGGDVAGEDAICVSPHP